jgi:hypothetical protein
MVNIDKNLLRGVSNCRCVLMFAPSRCRRRSKHGVVHRASFHPERSSTATGSDHPRCPQRSGPSFTFLSRAPRGPKNVAGSSRSGRYRCTLVARCRWTLWEPSTLGWSNGRSHITTRSQRPSRTKGGPRVRGKDRPRDPKIRGAS